MIYDVMIIGGGASGLAAACALSGSGKRIIKYGTIRQPAQSAVDRSGEGGRASPKIVILEKQPRVGRKLLSTGNGRCNLTNRRAVPGDYHGALNAVRAALKAWPPERVEAFFEGLGVYCTADEAGRVYPMSRQAASVLDALRLYCGERGVETITDFAVGTLKRYERFFEAVAQGGQAVRSRCCLVCTGGLAAPKLGASGDGYRLLEGFGHAILPRFPAITPLRTSPEAVRGLKGIRAEGILTLESGGESVRCETGEILFAEYGISGIAAMQLARSVNECLKAKRTCRLTMNFLPDRDVVRTLTDRARALPQRPMEDFLNGIVPKRLGVTLVRAAGLEMNRPAGDLAEGELRRLAGILSGWSLPVVGTQGFDQAQVTAGGASLGDFDVQTMGSLRVPGLYAAGEVLDVDGDCGGFNLQWAWSSALMAAEGIAGYLETEAGR